MKVTKSSLQNLPAASALAGLVLLAACAETVPAGTARPGESDSSNAPAAETTMPAEKADSARTDALVRANTAFALALYDRLAETEDGNLFFSPHSLSTALAMTLAGAEGATARQMAEALRLAGEGFTPGAPTPPHAAFGQLAERLNLPDTASVELRTANALWLQEGFPVRPAFRQRVEKHYRSTARSVDFAGALQQARRTINDWVVEQTEGKIDRIFEGSNDTRLALTNAVYFLGDWKTAFDSTRTRPDAFTLAGGGETEVPLMRQTGSFPYLSRPGFQALELPYEGERLAMTVFLPRAADGLPGFTRRLTPDSLAAWSEAMRRQRVQVFLPRFKMEMEESLAMKPALRELGMARAFTSAAEFDGMIAKERTGNIDLKIDAVKHKAFVDVDETGTEAAAATSVEIGVTSVPTDSSGPPVFRADHPFFFVIRDRATGALLFTGRLSNPEA